MNNPIPQSTPLDAPIALRYAGWAKAAGLQMIWCFNTVRVETLPH